MKKNVYVFVIFFVILKTWAYAQSDLPVIPNNAFVAGEKLTYEMGYGFITGGVASLSLEETEYEKKKVMHSLAVGRTVGIADKLFKVYDIYESYFDPQTGYPVKAIRNVSEDKYKRLSVDYFNHPENVVMHFEYGQKKDIKVPKNIFDVLSAFYYARRMYFPSLKPNQTVRINTFFHDAFWEMVIRYKGNEMIKLAKGKIDCLKFKPIVMKGTFESEDALDIWISNDANYIPIRVEMRFFVGAFRIDLVDWSGLKTPIKFK